ncbi:MAG: formyltetrahydrofolate deformylase [Micavibrio aeruginosavorus]|uniref:Formyltetrahydrofolate deformylase n=1 Tax=Micavibrio aeruginosavorus TaxID=349221 RepID=A0A2W5N6B8_9BACT|nr:MAG: formyltetrahydrofolate deformylase [Micavibrio aeruginosavorus]
MNVLRLHCVDQPGIVAAVAATLSNNQCNIEESSQFFDHFSGRFFMRVVFRPIQSRSLDAFLKDFPENAARFQMEWQVCDLAKPLRTLVLVSKADHCLHDLLYRQNTKLLPIDITGIVSNHTDLKPLADANKIPFHHCPIVAGNKDAQEKQIAALVENTGSELILLARYMQILSQQMCSNHAGRIINIHHSFLPGFKGARPYHQAYERGVKIIGATAHFATQDLDEGPIIVQDIERIDHSHTPEKMQQIGRDIESRAMARAVRLFAERRIFLHGARTVIL